MIPQKDPKVDVFAYFSIGYLQGFKQGFKKNTIYARDFKSRRYFRQIFK